MLLVTHNIPSGSFFITGAWLESLDEKICVLLLIAIKIYILKFNERGIWRDDSVVKNAHCP